MPQIETKTQNMSVYRLAFACMTIVCLFALATAVFADTASTDAQEVYIDSVYSWGIWELGLEPASGPEVAASNVINDRSRSLQFRPNDNAAYINPGIPIATTLSPPVIGVGGSGPILPGMVPNSPNLR